MAKKNEWLTARLPEPSYLPTPSFGINRALGGEGLASGRMHLYWGPKASGKTTACLKTIAKAQAQGVQCGFIDSEKAFSTPWAERNGVDVDSLYYKPANSAEDVLNLVVPALRSEEVGLIVVDSISSIVLAEFFEKSESNPMALYSRSSKFLTHKLLEALGYNQQIIFISHASMGKKGQHFVQQAAVGSAIDHWTSTQIRFRKGMSKEDIREDGAFKVHWKIEKSKQSVYPVEGSYYFNPFTTEIDYVDEVVTYAVEEGVLDKSGSWFTFNKGYPNEVKLQGTGQWTDALKDNPSLLQEFEQRLLANEVVALQEEQDD